MRSILDHVSKRKKGIIGVVVCAQRPLVGVATWQGDNVGNGVYYACGDVDEFGNVWEKLDASLVEYVDNEEIYIDTVDIHCVFVARMIYCF